MEQDPHGVHEAVRRQFSRNAEKYVHSPVHGAAAALDRLVRWLRPEPHWRVLDVATGGGHVARALSPHVAQVVAADLTEEMLRAARNHLLAAGCKNVLFVRADAGALPFVEGTFDAVTCRIAPHHFPDPQSFVQETARVLVPGGRFLLVDNISPEERELAEFINAVDRLRDPSHVYCAPVSRWRAWLAGTGLREDRSRLRRKTHPFTAWMERAGADDARIREVEALIKAAPADTRAYFTVKEEAGRVVSLEVDEWMVLCTLAGAAAAGEAP